MQIDVGEDWGGDPALRRAGERGVPRPILQVSGREHLVDQAEEPVVVDLLRQRRDHDLMVQRSEAVGYVSLDEPGRPGPGNSHFA